MIKLKGLYEWQLIDIESNEVVKSGQQWNTVSDAFLRFLCTNETILYGANFAIQLSDTVPTGGVNYRVEGASNGFNVLIASSFSAVTYNLTLNSVYRDNTFSYPGAPRTVNTIGVAVQSGTNYPNFVSFIQLSTPVVQQTNQYLYVKYTLFVTYVGAGLNQPVNRFINRLITLTLLSGSPQIFAKDPYNNFAGGLHLLLTPYIAPGTLNNVQRIVPYQYITNANSDFETNTGSIYASRVKRSLVTTDIPGPIGATVFGNYWPNDGVNYFSLTHGYSPAANQTPSISRIFVHPTSRISYIFSDPSSSPSSHGTLTLTGTPTQRFPIIGRINITRTGDASDIIDEVVPAANVNTGTYELTVAQVWATNDIIQLTTDGSLPSPLSVSTNYYAIYVDPTHIQLSYTFNGGAIAIATQGIGNHTLYRQNTAQYQLMLEPWIEDNQQFIVALSQNYFTRLPHLVMAQDINGTCMPGDYTATNDKGEGGTFSNAWYQNFPLVYAQAKQDDYLYTVQRSFGFTNLLTVCRWTFYSVETSQALCVFGNSSTIFRRLIQIGGIFYMATSDGIYKYDTSTPTTPPSLIVIAGIIDINIKDLAYDSITGYFWSGHSTGLSKINIGALTATTYTISGGQLTGLSPTYANISAGQIDVYNGMVLVGGYSNPYQDETNANLWTTWILKDGTGWYNINPAYYSVACCLRKSTQQVVVADRDYHYIKLYTVTVTGLGTGSAVLVEQYNSGAEPAYSLTNMVQLDDNNFLYMESNGVVLRYKVGQGLTRLTAGSGLNTTSRSAENSQVRNLIDVNGNGLNVLFYHEIMFMMSRGLMPTTYGWNGAAWVKNYTVNYNATVDTSFDLLNVGTIIPTGTPVFIAATTYPSPLTVAATGTTYYTINVDSTNIRLATTYAGAVAGTYIDFTTAGTNVVVQVMTPRYVPKTTTHNLLDGLVAAFNNATGADWNLNFIAGELFTCLYAPTLVKDNLQTMDVRARYYYCNANSTSSVPITISAPSYSYIIAEQSNPNFRDMDNLYYVTQVINGVTPLTVYTLPSGTSASVNTGTYQLNLAANIATGTPIIITANPFPSPLIADNIYYAINVDTTHIQLATTYANAIANVFIDLTTTGSNVAVIQVAPTTGTYYAGVNGIFVFSPTDVGNSLTLSYTYTLYN